MDQFYWQHKGFLFRQNGPNIIYCQSFFFSFKTEGLRTLYSPQELKQNRFVVTNCILMERSTYRTIKVMTPKKSVQNITMAKMVARTP